MKFLQKEDILFSDISESVKTLFPDVKVCALKSQGDVAGKDIIFVDENLAADQAVYEMTTKDLNHLLQKNEKYWEESLLASGRLLTNRAQYFDSSFCFMAETAEANTSISFEGAKDKANLKEQCLRFFEKIGSASVVAAADAIVEELYMNAVIDAPREAEKKGYQPRTSTKAEIYLSKTGNWLQIACTDSFGSLEIKKFLNRMNEVYQQGAGEVIQMDDSRGAGLGCVILFEQSTCLILGVSPGKMTKVMCLIPLGFSNRQRVEMKKSIHCFEL